jgi:hypothetical protein
VKRQRGDPLVHGIEVAFDINGTLSVSTTKAHITVPIRASASAIYSVVKNGCHQPNSLGHVSAIYFSRPGLRDPAYEITTLTG